MTTETLSAKRFAARREEILRRIAAIGPFVEGTLVKVPRKDCRHVAHRLTYKVERRTHAVYVPVERVRDVEAWIREYKRLKKLVRAVTEASRGELRAHVRSRRGDADARRSSVPRRPR